MEYFEFEDRKNIQAIIIELNNNLPEIIENTLHPHRTEVV